jgi:hypothetical protein
VEHTGPQGHQSAAILHHPADPVEEAVTPAIPAPASDRLPPVEVPQDHIPVVGQVVDLEVVVPVAEDQEVAGETNN